METKPLPICKFCSGRVYFEPGFMVDNEDKYSHEECLQRSGEAPNVIEFFYSDEQVVADYLDYFLLK